MPTGTDMGVDADGGRRARGKGGVNDRVGAGADGGEEEGGEREAGALAGELGERLLARAATLVTAESCTGGLLAAAVTGVPGSSGWFGTGFVTYADAAKRRLLGVPAATLERDGAVSEATVRAMASGARERADAFIAVAVSGIAGPDGGSAAKPVGTVWLGWARADGLLESERHHFAGDRAAVREAAVRAALRGTIRRVPDPREDRP